jgi:hypothetical protein
MRRADTSGDLSANTERKGEGEGGRGEEELLRVYVCEVNEDKRIKHWNA